MLAKLPGYGPDVEKNREEARAIMKKLGYGPDKRAQVKVATRNIAQFRDPAVILIDQLKHVYIDGELEPVETANWFPKIARKDYQIGLNLTGSSVDDPDQQFYENYYLRLAAQLQRLLQQGDRPADRPAIGRDAIRTSASRWSGRSTASCRRTRPGRSSCTTPPRPAGSPTSRTSPDGEQHLQRLAHGGLVARQGRETEGRDGQVGPR